MTSSMNTFMLYCKDNPQYKFMVYRQGSVCVFDALKNGHSNVVMLGAADTRDFAAALIAVAAEIEKDEKATRAKAKAGK